MGTIAMIVHMAAAIGNVPTKNPGSISRTAVAFKRKVLFQLAQTTAVVVKRRSENTKRSARSASLE
jgi:hypothetical protein